MHLSQHARIRSRQRGIPESAMDYIRHFGIEENAKGGAIRYRFTGKSYTEAEHCLKHILQELSKIKNRCVIVDEEHCTVITAY